MKSFFRSLVLYVAHSDWSEMTFILSCGLRNIKKLRSCQAWQTRYHKCSKKRFYFAFRPLLLISTMERGQEVCRKRTGSGNYPIESQIWNTWASLLHVPWFDAETDLQNTNFIFFCEIKDGKCESGLLTKTETIKNIFVHLNREIK